MKIAMTVNRPTLGDPISVRFGRGSYIMIADPDTSTFQYLENQYQTVRGEVSVSLAALLVRKGVDIAVASYWAPSDAKACLDKGTDIATVADGTIGDALLQFKTPSVAQREPIALAS